MMYIMSVPLMMPPETFPKVKSVIMDRGFLTPRTPLMFLFLVDKTFGQTINACLSGIVGVLMAVVQASILHAMVPGGVTYETQWVVDFLLVVMTVFFTIAVLWLNFGMVCRILSLSTFAYHWMYLMNPEKRECDVQMICSPNVGQIFEVLLASFAALFCNIFPLPTFALRKARMNARDVTTALSRALLEMANGYCGNQAGDFRQDKLAADLQKARDTLEVMDTHLLYSWYEFGWVKQARNIRTSLGRLRRSLQENADRIFSVWNICMQDSFGSLHEEMMPRMWPNVNRVLYESTRLLAHSTEVACAGRIFDTEESALRDSTERTRRSVAALATTFRETKASLGIDGVNQEMLDEHTFVLHVCAFGRLAAELGEDLLADKTALRQLPAPETPPALLSRSELTSRNHIAWTLRSFVALVIAAFLGIFGNSKTMLRYDAGTVVFTALLLQKTTASTQDRNLLRLKGVVIGTSFGSAAYAMLGWCTWWGTVLSSAAFFLGVGACVYHHLDVGRLGSNFVVGHFATGSTPGRLAAYCAAVSLIERCTTTVYSVLDVLGRSCYTIVNSLTAVSLTYIVELVAAPDTAAQLATRELHDAWMLLRSTLAATLDPRTVEVRLHSVEITVSLLHAQALGLQADREPRLWRTAWRGALFADVVLSATRIKMSLCGLQCSVVDVGRIGGGKAEKVRRLTSMPSFVALHRFVQEKMEQIHEVLQSALTQEVGDAMRALTNPYASQNLVTEFMQAMRTFVNEANRLPEMSFDKSAGNSLESEVSAIASLVLSSIAAIIVELQTLQSIVSQRALN